MYDSEKVGGFMTNTTTLPSLAEQGLSSYINQVNSFPMLEPEEEFMLSKAWAEKQDIKAAHKLVTSHLRLVVKIASGFRGYGLPMADVISEGNIGLMTAVKKFDPDKGFRLSTYAMWWIKASINEFVLKSWSLVKLGSSAAQKKLFYNLKRVKGRIAGIDKKSLTPDEITEIASVLDVTEAEVVEMDGRLSGADVSLNKPVSYEEDSSEWIDQISDKSPDQSVALEVYQEKSIQLKLLNAAMQKLNEREQEIIKARRLKEPADTLEDLSQKFKISRERVRQIENKAFEKLSGFMNTPALLSAR
jgi:RNA polymerase sigma-32 factor